MPGYALHELCHLARSTVPAQRVIALRVLKEVLLASELAECCSWMLRAVCLMHSLYLWSSVRF